MDPVEIRPPVSARVYVAVFMVFWCGSLAVFGARAIARGVMPTLAVLPLMLAFGVAVGYRLFRLGVVARGDVLEVRNNFRSRTVARKDVEGFRVGSPSAAGFSSGQVIYVLLRDDSVLSLDVTSTSLPLRRSREQVNQRLQRLRAWQEGAAPPA